MHTVLRSSTREVVIGDAHQFCVIGDRINPAGRKSLQSQLRGGDYSEIERDVAEQVAGGAMALNVNMAVPMAEEAKLMARAVAVVQSLTDLPLVIDSTCPDAVEAGLRAYEGRALVKCVTAEAAKSRVILRLVKQHEAAVICVPREAGAAAESPEHRLDLVRKIVAVAVDDYGLDPCDLVVDPLVMPIGADTAHVQRTFDTIKLIRHDLGLNMIVGASEVSSGMPESEAIVAAFLPMAISLGLTGAILDASSAVVVRAAKAADLLLDRDPWGAAWIARHRAEEALLEEMAEAEAKAAELDGLDKAAAAPSGV